MTAKRVKPLPCPFCGDAPSLADRLAVSHLDVRYRVYAECRNAACYAKPHIISEALNSKSKRLESAIERWNQRRSRPLIDWKSGTGKVRGRGGKGGWVLP